MEFNRAGAFDTDGGLALVAPFPPAELMQNTTGLTENRHFAEHGVAIFDALEKASPKPLNSYTNVLDFGVGVGRLARMFHGFDGTYTGVDIDKRHIKWVTRALKHVTPVLTKPRAPIPLADGQFDMIVSISVFTHMNEADCMFYIEELARLAAPGAYLFLTIHGNRALNRARAEENILAMLAIPEQDVKEAGRALQDTGFRFVRQDGHLTSDKYEYGITFIGEKYLRRAWAPMFESFKVISGAIHDFQDIVVLKKREAD